MNINFIRERITQLRIKHNISEYQMSLELGKSKSYIQGITSGKSLPSLTMVFTICDYLNVTPVELLDRNNISCNTSEPSQEVLHLLKQLNKNDIELLVTIMNRLVDNSSQNRKK